MDKFPLTMKRIVNWACHDLSGMLLWKSGNRPTYGSGGVAQERMARKRK